MNWENIRENYPLALNGGYFNTGSFGALSIKSINDQKQFLDRLILRGNGDMKSWIDGYWKLKDKIGQFLNCKTSEVAIFPDVSNGMNRISELIDKEKEVVLVESDFPSVTLPWITRNYKVDWISQKQLFDNFYEILEEKLKTENKVLAVSWVFYNHGLKLDVYRIGQICQKYDAMFVLDATQGLGAFQLDIDSLNVDFMISACFKWFLAGYGIAIGYASPSIGDKFSFPASGWNILKDFQGNVLDPNNYKTDASRFEIGHIKYQNIAALDSSMDQLQSIGYANISARVQSLVALLRQQLEDIDFEIVTPESDDPSGIISINGDKQLYSNLRSKGITCTQRDDYIRLSVYFYNNEQDIGQLINILKKEK